MGILAEYNGNRLAATQAVQNAAQEAYNQGKLHEADRADVFAGVISIEGNMTQVKGRAFNDGRFELGTVGSINGKPW